MNINHLETAVQAAVKAGEAILEVYARDFDVEFKSDRSPLTEADKRSNEVILDALIPTGIPVISEEARAMDYKERAGWDLCWIVDPLDGTKEFIKRNGEFTVNIALVEKGSPVIGVVYVPVKRDMYFGSKKTGSGKFPIREGGPLHLGAILLHAEKFTKAMIPGKYTVIASRSHLSPETEKFIAEKRQEHGEVEKISAGSSLKLCLVAEGKANVYPRPAPTMEWDTAAGHAVAQYAGCKVYDFHSKEELRYNKQDLHNPWFIVEK